MANGKLDPEIWGKDLIDLMQQESLYKPQISGKTATQIMMEEQAQHDALRYLTHHRAIGKPQTMPRWNQPISMHSIGSNDLRSAGTGRVAMDRGLYAGEFGAILMDQPAPTSTKEDREFLGLTIAEYQKFCEAVQTQCFLNREGNLCKLKNAKTKKLKNLRYKIIKSEHLMKSMIWREQLRLIEIEIAKRQR